MADGWRSAQRHSLNYMTHKRTSLIVPLQMNVDALEFSPDGTEMLIADGNLLHRLDTATGRVTETLTGGDRRINDLAYSPDGKQIASIDWRGVVRLWEKHVKAFTFRREDSRSGKYTLLFSPDGQAVNRWWARH